MDECATQVLHLNDSLELDDRSSKEEFIDIQIGTLVVDGESHDIYPGDYVIGRNPLCTIVIDKKSVSGRHACIEATSARSVQLYDLGSANKTRLGKLVLRPKVRHNLYDGAEVLFADTMATFHIKEEDDVVVPETPAHARPKFASSAVAESTVLESPVVVGESPTSDDSCIGPSPTGTPNSVLVQRGSTTARRHLDLLDGNDEVFAAVTAGTSTREADKEANVVLRRRSDAMDMDDSDWIYDAETQKVSTRVEDSTASESDLSRSIYDAETQEVSARVVNSDADLSGSIYDAETQKVSTRVEDNTNSENDLSESIYDAETQKVSTRVANVTTSDADLSDSIYDAETQKVSTRVTNVTTSDADLSDSIYDAETQKVLTRIEDSTNSENDLSDSIYDAKTQKVVTLVESIANSDNDHYDSIHEAEAQHVSARVNDSTNSDSSIYDAETQKVATARVENVANSGNAVTQKVLPDDEDVTRGDDIPDWDKETASLEDGEGCDLQSVEQERSSNVEESDDIHDQRTQKVLPNDEDDWDKETASLEDGEGCDLQSVEQEHPSNVEESDDIHDQPTQKVLPNGEDDWDKETASLEDGEGCDLQSVEQERPLNVEESDDQPTQKVSTFRSVKANSVHEKPLNEAHREFPSDNDLTDADEDRESPSLLQDYVDGDEGKGSLSLLQDYEGSDEDIGSPSLLQDVEASHAPIAPAKSATTTKSELADKASDSDHSLTNGELRATNSEEGSATKGHDIVDAETVATAMREPAKSVMPPEQVAAEADGGSKPGTVPRIVTEEKDQFRDPQVDSNDDVFNAETQAVCVKDKKVVKLDSQDDVYHAETQVVCGKNKKEKLAPSLDTQDDVHEAETQVTCATNKKLAPSLDSDIHEAETQVDNIHDAETQVLKNNDNIDNAVTTLENKDDNIHDAETQVFKEVSIHDAETQAHDNNDNIHKAETQIDNIHEAKTQVVKAMRGKTVVNVASSAASDGNTFDAKTQAGHPVAIPSIADSYSQDVGTKRWKRTTRRLPSSSDAETNGTKDAESNVSPVTAGNARALRREHCSGVDKASDLDLRKGRRRVDEGDDGPDGTDVGKKAKPVASTAKSSSVGELRTSKRRPQTKKTKSSVKTSVAGTVADEMPTVDLCSSTDDETVADLTSIPPEESPKLIDDKENCQDGSLSLHLSESETSRNLSEGGSYVEEASTQPSEAYTSRYNESSSKGNELSLKGNEPSSKDSQGFDEEDDLDMPSSQTIFNLLATMDSPRVNWRAAMPSSPLPPPSPLMPPKRSRCPSKRLQEVESLFASSGKIRRGKAPTGGWRGKPSKLAAGDESDDEMAEEIPGVDDSPGPSSGKRQRHGATKAAVDRSVKQAPLRKRAAKPVVSPVAGEGFADDPAQSDGPARSGGPTAGPQAVDLSEESPVLVKRGRKPSKRLRDAGSLTVVRRTNKSSFETGPAADSESSTCGEKQKVTDESVKVVVEPGNCSVGNTGKGASRLTKKEKSGKKVTGLAVATKGKGSSTVASSVHPSDKRPKPSDQVGSPDPTIDETSTKTARKRAGLRDVECFVKPDSDSWESSQESLKSNESSLPMKRERKPSRRMKDADYTFLNRSGRKSSTESQEKLVRAVEKIPETKDEDMRKVETVLEDNVGEGVKGKVGKMILALGKTVTVKDRSRGRVSTTATSTEEIDEKSEVVASSEKQGEKLTEVTAPVAAKAAAADESPRVYSTRKKEAKPYAAWIAGKSPFVTSPPKRQKLSSKVTAGNASEPADVPIAVEEAQVATPAVATVADIPATELPPSRRKANVGRPASVGRSAKPTAGVPAIVEPVIAVPSPKRKSAKKSGVDVVAELLKNLPPPKLVTPKIDVPVELVALPSTRQASRKPATTANEKLTKDIPLPKLVIPKIVIPVQLASAAHPSTRKNARKTVASLIDEPLHDLPSLKIVTPKMDVEVETVTAPSKRKSAKKASATVAEGPGKNLPPRHAPTVPDVAVAPSKIPPSPKKSLTKNLTPTASRIAVAPVTVQPSPKRKGAKKTASPAPQEPETVEASSDGTDSVPSTPKKANKRSAVGWEPDEGLTPTKRRKGKRVEEEAELPVVAQVKKRGRPTKVSVSGAADGGQGTSDVGLVAQLKTEAPLSPSAQVKKRGRPTKVSVSGAADRGQGTSGEASVAPVKTEAQLTPRRSARDASKDTSHPRVLFTTTTNDIDDAAAILERLGGSSVDTPDECSVLVTNRVRRTYKFLCCMARGKPIASPEWLRRSQQRGSFLDPWDFLVSDVEAEQKFSFSLSSALRRASESRLLEGYCVFVTAGVRPPPEEMRDIVLSCGGAWLARPPARWAQLSFAVTCAEDRRAWPALRGAPHVVSAELILRGVLQQRLDFEAHAMK